VKGKKIFCFIDFKNPPDIWCDVVEFNLKGDAFIHSGLFFGKIHIKVYFTTNFGIKTDVARVLHAGKSGGGM
jgi:hypothetical protein